MSEQRNPSEHLRTFLLENNYEFVITLRLSSGPLTLDLMPALREAGAVMTFDVVEKAQTENAHKPHP